MVKTRQLHSKWVDETFPPRLFCKYWDDKWGQGKSWLGVGCRSSFFCSRLDPWSVLFIGSQHNHVDIFNIYHIYIYIYHISVSFLVRFIVSSHLSDREGLSMDKNCWIDVNSQYYGCCSPELAIPIFGVAPIRTTNSEVASKDSSWKKRDSSGFPMSLRTPDVVKVDGPLWMATGYVCVCYIWICIVTLDEI